MGKEDIIRQLRREILTLQGLREAGSEFPLNNALSNISHVFPQGVFPFAAIHEITSADPLASAACGFLCFLLSRLVGRGEIAVWVSTHRRLFPPALAAYGIEPDRIIFLDMASDRDALWAMEEALRCDQLAVVVGEIQNLSFTASRRLQLAVEKSKVTGFVLRPASARLTQNACFSRWRINTVASGQPRGVPGVGNTRWKVELTKMKGGKPGNWLMEWNDHDLEIVTLPQEQAVAARKIV